MSSQNISIFDFVPKDIEKISILAGSQRHKVEVTFTATEFPEDEDSLLEYRDKWRNVLDGMKVILPKPKLVFYVGINFEWSFENSKLHYNLYKDPNVYLERKHILDWGVTHLEDDPYQMTNFLTMTLKDESYQDYADVVSNLQVIDSELFKRAKKYFLPISLPVQLKFEL